MTIITSCSSDKKTAQNVEQTIEILRTATSKGKVLFGHQDFAFYGTSWFGEHGRADVKDVCGDYPSVLGCDLGEIELGGPNNLDGVPFEMMRREIISQHNRGGISTISWHPRNPLTAGDAWDVSDASVVKSILPEGINHSKFSGWLDMVANFIDSLETSEGVKVTVIFRPWHEHMGSWFWWGRDLCTTEEYKELWKMTLEHLERKGITNIITAYSPNLLTQKEEFLERYPGDEYIDILGVDSYHYGVENAQYFINDLSRALGMMSELAAERNKLVAVTETGLESVPMPKWWTEVIYKAIEDHPVCYVLVWRNAYERENHYFAPYPGQVSAKDFKVFYDLPQTVFAGDMNSLRK